MNLDAAYTMDMTFTMDQVFLYRPMPRSAKNIDKYYFNNFRRNFCMQVFHNMPISQVLAIATHWQ